MPRQMWPSLGKSSTKVRISTEKTRQQAIVRAQRSRERRICVGIELTESVDDSFTRNIVSQLLRFVHVSSPYTIINNVIQSKNIIKNTQELFELVDCSPMTSCLDKTRNVDVYRWFPINFNNDNSHTFKYMTRVPLGQKDKLIELLNALVIVLPDHSPPSIQYLLSEKGDCEQRSHADLPEPLSNYIPKNLKKYYYSMIIALCDDTRILMGTSRSVVHINKGDMVIFRGDTTHAGASYLTHSNFRYFIASHTEHFNPRKKLTLR